MTPSRGQAAVRGRPRVALHRCHLMAPARQAGADEQAGRARADDGYAHDDHPTFGILIM